MDAIKLQKFDNLSPFEIKDELIRLARRSAASSNSISYLNAGRGNPNWVATVPRDGFFLFGQFAVTECIRVMDVHPGIGGMPTAPGIARRLAAFLAEREDSPSAAFLSGMVKFACEKFGFEADAFVYELTDAIIGDQYPEPGRMLAHNEKVVHEYLQWAMCGSPKPEGKFDIFAVEGGTAAMCYLFKSLKCNRLLKPGDTIALGTPIFTPYLEMPHLEDYALNVVCVGAEAGDRYQLTDEDMTNLENPKVKAFFLVNPGNPTGVALGADSLQRIVALVTNKRPDLIIVTDDVYGTFVHGFRSLLGALPRNTIGVYSYSKYFGCTGWRLGTIAIHENNIFDEMLERLPESTKQLLDARYGPISLTPRKIKFIARIVADSRDVALNHTSGLSLPQQVMMCMFSLYELMDESKEYQKVCMEIVHRRFRLAVDALGIELPGDNPNYDAYYGLFDLEFWLKKYVGEEVVAYIKENVHPLDIVFRLADEHGVVLLNGGRFQAPDWSVRASFANLKDEEYTKIGLAVRAVSIGYVREFEASKKATAAVR
jgi:aspartate 4-decarboxylase